MFELQSKIKHEENKDIAAMRKKRRQRKTGSLVVCFLFEETFLKGTSLGQSAKCFSENQEGNET